MLIRRHETPALSSEAIYSDCEAYRYRLTRRWSDGEMLNFIMLNPSVADEMRNDPTVERCERRARQLGFGAFVVTNIFAWRDTDPFAMRRAKAPVGPENNTVLVEATRDSSQIIAAWGTHGKHRERGSEVADMLRSEGVLLHHLGLSKEGHPRHPLYVPYAQRPMLWERT